MRRTRNDQGKQSGNCTPAGRLREISNRSQASRGGDEGFASHPLVRPSVWVGGVYDAAVHDDCHVVEDHSGNCSQLSVGLAEKPDVGQLSPSPYEPERAVLPVLPEFGDRGNVNDGGRNLLVEPGRISIR